MKYNEAIYRSPKWLRNFVDYEVNTGDDIKGTPSLRKQKQINKKAEADRMAKLFADWDERWRSADESSFIKFFEETYNINIYRREELFVIKNQFRGDNNLWKMYDAYLAKEQKKNKNRIDLDKIKRELKKNYMIFLERLKQIGEAHHILIKLVLPK